MRRSHKLLSAAVATVLAGTGGIGFGLVTGPASADAAPGSTAPPTTTTTTTTTTVTGTPTAAQVRTAVRTATRSRALWATINRCDASGSGVIGIRGQMPALDFPAHLNMIVTLDAFSPDQLRYVPLHGHWRLGGKVFDTGHTVQEGINLRFPSATTLVGHITFQWVRNGIVLGQTTRITRSGHRDDSGRPRSFSVGACSLG